MKTSPMGHAWYFLRKAGQGANKPVCRCANCGREVSVQHLIGDIPFATLDGYFPLPCGEVSAEGVDPLPPPVEREPWMDAGDYERFRRQMEDK